jgi:hypothetical protein
MVYLGNLIVGTVTGRADLIIWCFWHLLLDSNTPKRSNPRIFFPIHKRNGNTLTSAPEMVSVKMGIIFYKEWSNSLLGLFHFT